MEKMGANVVCLESPNGLYKDYIKNKTSVKPRRGIQEQNLNAFWYIKNKLKSKNKLFLWDIYKELPPKIGSFDISVFAMNISRFRDPFLALMNIALGTKETIIVTNEFVSSPSNIPFAVLSTDDCETWWYPTANVIVAMMERLGFKLIRFCECKPKNEGVEKKYGSLVFSRY